MNNDEIIEIIKKQGRIELVQEIEKSLKPLDELNKENKLEGNKHEYLRWVRILLCGIEDGYLKLKK